MSYSQETEPRTEPLDSGYDCSSQESTQTPSELDFWGRLYPLKASLKVVDLVSNSVTFGKTDTDIVITVGDLPREVFKKCSKLHFEIHRKQIRVMGAMSTQIVLLDQSSNGTFINNNVVRKRNGPPREKVLRSNDVIGLPAGSPLIYEAYVFVDCLLLTTSKIPYAVRQKYEISYRLGAGAFGEVSLIFCKTKGQAYAMKSIFKEGNARSKVVDSYKKRLLNELDILQSVDHPNVIKLIDVVDCVKEHYLILEFMEGRDLSERIAKYGKLDESISKLYFYQIAKGVQYLHNLGIIHRDLKPANVLLCSEKTETIVKITDFGLSKVLSPATMMKTLCGTKLFVAPEVLLGGGLYEYTEKVDVWSMGVILYLCLSGREPFISEEEEVEDLIKEASFSMPPSHWNIISNGAKSLINHLLVKEAASRLEVAEVLANPWLQDRRMRAKANELYKELDVDEYEHDQDDSLMEPPSKKLKCN